MLLLGHCEKQTDIAGIKVCARLVLERNAPVGTL